MSPIGVEQPDEETLALIGWGWKHIPGLILAYLITGRESLLEAVRRAQENPADKP